MSCRTHNSNLCSNYEEYYQTTCMPHCKINLAPYSLWHDSWPCTYRVCQLSHPTWKYLKHTSNKVCHISSDITEDTEFCLTGLPTPTLLLPNTNNALEAWSVSRILVLLRHICFIHYIEYVQYKFYPRRYMLENHSISNMCLYIQLKRAA